MSGTRSPNREQLLTPNSQSIPRLNLCIKSQDGGKAYYRIRGDKPIKRLLMAYCEHKNLEYAAAQFLYEGARVTATRTPDEIGMKTGDEIDVMYHVLGGGFSLAK